MHRSSAERATLGNSSLISRPLWPYLLKLKGDLRAAPVGLSVFKYSIGIFFPSYFVNAGFGSNVST